MVAAAADRGSNSTAKSTGWSFAGLSTGYYYQSADFDNLPHEYAVNGVPLRATKAKGASDEHGFSLAAGATYTVGSSEQFSWGIQVEPEVMLGVADVEFAEDTADGAVRIIADTVRNGAGRDLNSHFGHIVVHQHYNYGIGLDGLVRGVSFLRLGHARQDDQQQLVRYVLGEASNAAGVQMPDTDDATAARLAIRQGILAEGSVPAEPKMAAFVEKFTDEYINRILDPGRTVGAGFANDSQSQRIGALLEFAKQAGRTADKAEYALIDTPPLGRYIDSLFGDITALPVTPDSNFEADNNGQSITSFRGDIDQSPTLVHITLPVYAVANMRSERFNANFGVGTGVMFYDVGNELSDGKAWPILAKTSINVPVNDRVSVGGGLRFHYSLISSGDIDSIWGIRADALISYSF